MITPVSEKTGLRLLELFREHGSNPFILMLWSTRRRAGRSHRCALRAANFLMRLSDTAQLLHAMEETLKEQSSGGAVWSGQAPVPGRGTTLTASIKSPTATRRPGTPLLRTARR